MHVKKEKEPAVSEPAKKMLVIAQSTNSPKTKPIVDLFMKLKRSAVKYVDREGLCLPSADNSAASNGRLEAQLKRADASLFVYVHSVKGGKVRVVCGRSFEYELIDVCQFEVAPSAGPPEWAPPAIELNSLAIVCTNGRHPCGRVQNLLLDLLREDIPRAVGVRACTHAYCLTFIGSAAVLDVLGIEGKPASLAPLCPPLRLTLLGNYHCDAELFKDSKRAAEQGGEKKRKNMEDGGLNAKLGILHMEKQDLREIKLRKGKAFSRARAKAKVE